MVVFVLIELKIAIFLVDKCSCSGTDLSQLVKSFAVPIANIKDIAIATATDSSTVANANAISSNRAVAKCTIDCIWTLYSAFGI